MCCLRECDYSAVLSGTWCLLCSFSEVNLYIKRFDLEYKVGEVTVGTGEFRQDGKGRAFPRAVCAWSGRVVPAELPAASPVWCISAWLQAGSQGVRNSQSSCSGILTT